MDQVDKFVKKHSLFFQWQYFIVYYLIVRFASNISYNLIYIFIIIMLIVKIPFEKISLIFFVIALIMYILGKDVEANHYFSFIYVFLCLTFIRYLYFTAKERSGKAKGELMKFIQIFCLFSFLFLIILIFRNWFGLDLIAGGDFQIYYPEMLRDLSSFPSAWNWTVKSGLGANGASLLWNYLSVSFPISILGSGLGLDWQLVQRIGYLYPFLVLIFISPYIFFRKYFSFPWVILPISIFCFNTYILMLTAGGQIFLSLAYALVPLVFYCFYKLSKDKFISVPMRVSAVIVTTLVFSLQLLFDVRIAYVTLTAVAFYILLAVVFFRENIKNLINFPPVFLGTALLHAFWILPTILLRQNPLEALGSEFVSVGIIDFFSFAKFENTISLLQPNWPENIFGKTYFFKPEFLFLPILAFSSLLFVKNEKKEVKELVAFFAITALLFAFLAKGTTDPFGKLYSWMFSNVPGFVMFRDPTKWYAGVAFAYAFLIPFTVKKIYEKIKSSDKFLLKNQILNMQNLFLLILVLYLLFLIRPALSGQLGGIFRTTQIPMEYLELREFITNQPEYFRTIWIPQSSKYSFYSSNYPLISGTGFLGNYSINTVAEELLKESSRAVLEQASVRYIIVPSDPDGAIFLTDRIYDEEKYLKTVSEIEKVSYLKEVEGFGKIKVFEVPNGKDHFFGTIHELDISWVRKNSSEYILNIKNARKGDVLVFSENFDKNWEASSVKLAYFQKSIRYNKFFNSFILPADGEYPIRVYYKPQDLVKKGIIISLTGVVIIVIIGIYCLIKLRNGRKT